MTNAEFSAALRQALRESGKKQAEVARAVGVHQSTVSRWLAGEDQPHGRHLHKLAAFLGAPHLAMGSEGLEQVEARVMDLLLQIAERAMIGAGLPLLAYAPRSIRRSPEQGPSCRRCSGRYQHRHR